MNPWLFLKECRYTTQLNIFSYIIRFEWETRFTKRNLRFFIPSLKLSSFTWPSLAERVDGISFALICLLVNISIFISSENGIPLLNASRGCIFDKASRLMIHMPDWESRMFTKKRIRRVHANVKLPNRCLRDIEPCFNAAKRSVVIKSRFWFTSIWTYSWMRLNG